MTNLNNIINKLNFSIYYLDIYFMVLTSDENELLTVSKLAVSFDFLSIYFL